MKKLLTILFFLSALTSNAQRTMFGAQNNYVAPVIPFQAPAVVTSGLVLYLDAANPSSYPGAGSTWTDLSISGNVGTFIGATSYSSSDPVPTSIGWYNFVFTWGNGYINLYRNGVSVATPVASSISAQILTTTLNIGGYIFGGAGGDANTFNGKIPFVTLYNRSITPAEVLTNFDAVKTRFGL